jgi:hypothetical protein
MSGSQMSKTQVRLVFQDVSRSNFFGQKTTNQKANKMSYILAARERILPSQTDSVTSSVGRCPSTASSTIDSREFDHLAQ